MKSSVALMLLVMASLPGCVASGRGPSEYCLIAKPIYFDPADRMTQRTERAIIAHNETGGALCGWK